ncbi:sigma-70 family RNA polymerase sigma factor [Azospirillum brasilense]|uniref:RNA polymerase sigma-70 region 2 domain-containing protein n=1 Tax=Azospirillum brasilense TaxID=192 RepID=A0A6L3AT26_AZOBR|nr:sigma-70 family RNA polymerase sigma factor [Azospirillum brasilense]KAA0678207.1 hypothetical protein DS837_28230 [Azospirillum brasilense]
MDHSLSAFIAAQKFLTAAEERDLIERAQAGSKRARDRLVESHLPLVAKTAANIARWSGIPFDELLNEGVIEVAKAVDRFDLARKARLSTAATQSVNRAIVEYVIKNRSMVFHGGRQARAAYRMLATYSRERLEDDLDAVIGEIAAALELDKVDQRELYRSRIRDTFLDKKVGADSDATIGDMMSSGEDEDDMIERCELNRRLALLDRALASLSEMEREIYRGRNLSKPEISWKALSERFRIRTEMVKEINDAVAKKVAAFILSGGKSAAPKAEVVAKVVEAPVVIAVEPVAVEPVAVETVVVDPAAEEAVTVETAVVISETSVVASDTAEIVTPVVTAAEATPVTQETSLADLCAVALRRLALADELSFGSARAMVAQHLASKNSGRRVPALPATPILMVPRQVGNGVARDVGQHLTLTDSVMQRHISSYKKSGAAPTTELVAGATTAYSRRTDPAADGEKLYGDGGKPYDKVSYRQTDGEAPRVDPGAASRPAPMAETMSGSLHRTDEIIRRHYQPKTATAERMLIPPSLVRRSWRPTA